MGNYRIAVLPGDGIGQEVTSGAVDVLKAVGIRFGHEFTFEYGLIGGAAIDEAGTPLPEETLRLCQQSDAVLLGAVGGPKWDENPPHLRPEKGLLAIRQQLGLYANLRPVVCYDSLASASPLKPDLVQDVDFIIVRELTGGIYFGQPSGRVVENGEEKAVDTLLYKKEEIERIVRMAFTLARGRKKKVTSVDKANVLSSSRLWREVAEEVAKQFPDVELEHMLVDNAAMQLIRAPKQFDVIVTENMFGDILSDEASMLSGSLGMLPSASLSASGPSLYEPVHGSAPDIAGMRKANPIAAILSAAMMLRLSFGLAAEAEAIEHAVQQALTAGLRTADLAQSSGRVVSTDEMVEEIKTAVLDYTAIAQIMTVYA
ncbi:3-isopropylmalate dehydrogenase [Geobacillus subterraneus]|uniref:3-isopropylmalate dehydrogenase n=2 Tax=Geobacillus TaxID=129337 RepID=A0ABN4NDS3_9BACL|nr:MULTISPECIES: 3-isopropylmalate dehydrogenase [Geobacillus]AMX82710.1 3-isopropylmalate dehydrogenase [Geobacillus subterraneus]KZS26207.1 3-isopropylmalate dehydrogenase [Geobacillus subterraneus]OXB90803.1 3-isopropylmalate dehydrogenase [Geobacillus uzenensis]QIZ68561.1 3-isopropylmalate dehydrogenase [Geobacillus subterraneus]WPZ17587.1 3-isopropylmalate dehydrogenase [Geobacillus subterraneus]